MKADFPAVSKYSICHRRFLIVNYWQTVRPNQHQLSQLMLSCFRRKLSELEQSSVGSFSCRFEEKSETAKSAGRPSLHPVVT